MKTKEKDATIWYNNGITMRGGIMNRYKTNTNRDQLNFIPQCLDDMISADNEVRAIDAIVNSLDITDMGFIYSEPSKLGESLTVQWICSNYMHTAILMEFVHHVKLNVRVIET